VTLVEKAVFDCLEADGTNYEDFEEDFLMNLGPALDPTENEVPEDLGPENEETENNEGVKFVKGEIETKLEEMREKMKERGFYFDASG